MSHPSPENPESGKPKPGGPPDYITQEVQHSQISARVPERVGRGVFSNGVLVIHGATEFILDFVQRIAKPQQVVARVVMAPPFIPNLIGALTENLNRYQNAFGPPPSLLRHPPPEKPPSIEEIYDQLKLPDDLLSGTYANAAMITHTQAEFCLDFITNLYPRSAVACRVYLATQHVPGLIQSLTQSFQQYQQKMGPKHPGQGERGA